VHTAQPLLCPLPASTNSAKMLGQIHFRAYYSFLLLLLLLSVLSALLIWNSSFRE
jgi:hypothetical protein